MPVGRFFRPPVTHALRLAYEMADRNHVLGPIFPGWYPSHSLCDGSNRFPRSPKVLMPLCPRQVPSAGQERAPHFSLIFAYRVEAPADKNSIQALARKLSLRRIEELKSKAECI